jgi:hypothetical protein
LLVLVLTTTPWLIGQVRRAWQTYFIWVLVLLWFGFTPALHADPNLRVWGTVSLQEFNPRTGEPYPQHNGTTPFSSPGRSEPGTSK